MRQASRWCDRSQAIRQACTLWLPCLRLAIGMELRAGNTVRCPAAVLPTQRQMILQDEQGKLEAEGSKRFCTRHTWSSERTWLGHRAY